VLPPYYRIEVFGGLCLIADGQVTLRFRSDAAESLLALLAYRSVRYHPADLYRLLWPNHSPVEAATSLAAAIATLRHHLEPAPIAPGRVLQVEDDQIFLAPTTFETDVAELRAALALTAPNQPQSIRRQALHRAVLLYGGELLAGLQDAWVAEERAKWAIIAAAAHREWTSLSGLAVVTQRPEPQRSGAPGRVGAPVSSTRWRHG
jgi:DNA-binding SARP family transcriptional activator